jgi:anti-sigma factor RsiW
VTVADDMSCRELVELVTDYLEGALAPADRRRFEAHVTECDGCAAYLAQMRDTLRVAGRLREDALPEDAREALLRVFRGWKTS